MKALVDTKNHYRTLKCYGLMGLVLLTITLFSHSALSAPFTGIPIDHNDRGYDLFQAWNTITGHNLTSNAELEPFRLSPSLDQVFSLNALSVPIISVSAHFTNTLGFYSPGDIGSLELSDNPVRGYTNRVHGTESRPFVSTTFNISTLPDDPVALALHSQPFSGESNLFFSEDYLNQSAAPVDHLVAYNVGDNLLSGLLADFGFIDMRNPVMVGFEDIPLGFYETLSPDFDFDDIIFLVDAAPVDTTPTDVPLPGTLWLFAGGLLASGVVNRRIHT